MSRTRFLALTIAGVSALALFLGCHLIAVPIASALRPHVSSATPTDLGLTYRSLTLRGAHAVRLPAWDVEPLGGGRERGIVVLLAENGGNRASPRMLWLAREVAGMGFRALLVDLRGHGESSGVNTYGLGETMDLLAVLAHLEEQNPERPIGAVGFSLGAACILRAMSMTDAIRVAVVFAPYARLDRELIRHELEYQARGSRLRPLVSLLSPALLGAALRMWAGFPSLREPMDLATDRPVLLFHCTGDPEIPFEHARAIAAHARAPRLLVHPVERNEHIPSLEDAVVWGSFIDAVGDALDRWLRAPATSEGAAGSPP